jgi:hypothetical protein
MSTDCVAPAGDRQCAFRAKTVVDGKPLCTRHAKAAARKAAEAEKEAAFWQKMFTPTPEWPFAGDPEWQAAQREVVNPPGANAYERMGAALKAIARRQQIEERWERQAGRRAIL